MCLRNLQKYLVYGALIKGEKLTFLLPMYLLNLAWIMGTSTQLMGVSTPPRGSTNVPMCLRTYKNIWCMEL